MKRVIFLFMVLLPTYVGAQSSITVEIVNLESNKGRVIVNLLDKYEKDVDDISAIISNHKCTVTFKDITPGEYAIRFIHDENQNKELDTNFLGIPKEGFGFSNDAIGRFGPKDFNEWLFDVSGDTKIRLTAKYLF
jgi:uncharacterized protein (DUF2141 family)